MMLMVVLEQLDTAHTILAGSPEICVVSCCTVFHINDWCVTAAVEQSSKCSQRAAPTGRIGIFHNMYQTFV